uniref:ATP-binding cassette transporter YOR1 n=1 Tax=Kwoniella dejecticola CBS 10117 TaxID=1296121 RepID=A0A1A6A8U9_9TREE|nr:uncharacterized protein I303_02491 [Kwoniella dejecticola CBS 10117]OBR86484.1 hypothetical protein I303_02491 [Kwoniella dejecticola CBS 10117]
MSSKEDARESLEKTQTNGPDTTPSKLRDLSDSEVQQFPGIIRDHWWQLWRPRHSPPPPKATLEEAEIIPLAYVSMLSKLTFQWVTPIMVKGYQRPLQATDLWKMDPSREAAPLSTRFLEALRTRQVEAQKWNDRLDSAVPSARLRARWRVKAMSRRGLPQDLASFGPVDSYEHRYRTLESEWRQRSGRKRGSVTWALNDVMEGFWAGGLFKVASDTSQLMIPLLIKALINFSKEVYAANNSDAAQPNIGRGVGMAIGLFLLTVMQSVCQHQFFFRSMATGVLARATLISAIYQKAMMLSVGGRAQHPNGKLLTYLSSDVSDAGNGLRLRTCTHCSWQIWTAPIQLTITLVLLIVQIGPSALVGFSLFVILAPLQTWFMKLSFKVRKKSMKWTDSRARLLRELLSSMEVIKVFTYEIPFLKRLKHFRRKEMVGIRKILVIRAANQALAFSVPGLASVLAFVTYAATHDSLDPALIFTSLAFFNLLRQPLMFLPRALSSLTDAQNAVERLTEVFEAEVRDKSHVIDPDLKLAVSVANATFSWSSMAKTESAVGETFTIKNLNLSIPRGTIVGIVGSVGSGKSSLLQGLIGEMSILSGSVTFGGRLAYCQQNAWIQNATVRDNILFGQAWDESRYWKAVQASNLVPDLEILADGDLTEVSKTGINLSGGQKQRVNIARALYYDADIVLFDDPLSAVDAHVGKALFENAIMPLAAQGKTVLLVTHALHFLPAVDRIYFMSNGQISEQGSFAELSQSGGAASKLFAEFGGREEEKEERQASSGPEPESEAVEKQTQLLSNKSMGKAVGTGKLEGRLMVSEIRKTGSVGRKVYAGYLHAGRSRYTFPLTVFFATIMQGSQVMATVWLTWWQESHFNQTWSVYQGVYAALGISQALFTFAMGATLGVMANLASQNLHSSALENVFYSPKSVFDTQPLGRVLGVFGKDIDTIDNQLPDSLRMMAMTLVTLIGSVAIITVFLHYFIAVIFFVGVGYWYFALFYRTSSREVKRLDSMLRSLLYSHFSESLSGLATIRAYGETDRFIKDNAYYMDLENRAYLLSATNQRWLSIRLDFLGACLVFAVAIMSAKGGGGITAAQIALCLTYLTSITQVLGMVTRQSAEVENNMNAVERVLWYADAKSLPQEPAHVIPSTQPEESWPREGAIEFKDVVMSYRPGLPPVLKGLSMSVCAGEKIGIIGRTGAGKTSITIALFRLVELSSGSIQIDGEDISKVGLNALRSRIAIIPQDPVLFSGTLRTNLDPFDLYEDATLYDALTRSCVITSQGDNDHKRLTLDSVIEEEGQNLSVGERSLISLARALVKNSKIVVLDFTNIPVDLETDSRIQQTIHREFRGKTLLCIAHRLRTIISWDKILVMNAGEIEEFDTPLRLFDTDGLFRSMCEKSSITREDIVQARQAELQDEE